MSNTLHLHIGIHKTGSSSLQQFLSVNHQQLASLGYLYPMHPDYYWRGEASHSFLAHSLRQQRPHYLPENVSYNATKAYSRLTQDFDSLHHKDMILSSEHFSLFYSNADVQLLADELYKVAKCIKVYVYLRRQDYAIEANYKQGLRSKAFNCDFATYVKRTLDSEYFRYDYASMVANYGEHFGIDNVTARIYERSKLINGSVIDDFLTLLGLKNTPTFNQVPLANSSWPPALLEFLRHFAPHVNRQQWQQLKRNAVKQQHLFSTNAGHFLTTKISRQLIQLYQSSNEALRELPLKSNSTLIFDDVPCEFHHAMPSISQDELARLASAIFIING